MWQTLSCPRWRLKPRTSGMLRWHWKRRWARENPWTNLQAGWVMPTRHIRTQALWSGRIVLSQRRRQRAKPKQQLNLELQCLAVTFMLPLRIVNLNMEILYMYMICIYVETEFVYNIVMYIYCFQTKRQPGYENNWTLNSLRTCEPV